MDRERNVIALRHWVYILAHLLLIAIGFALNAQSASAAKTIGTGLVAAGVSGLVLFVYVWLSHGQMQRADRLKRFGFVDAFEARSVMIKEQYVGRIAKAKKQIDVLGFGLNHFLHDYQESFAELKHRAKIRILLIDPAVPSKRNSFANQRSIEEGHEQTTIAKHVEEFIAKTRSAWEPDKFEVRLYSCLPSLNLFRIDDEVFWGPYLIKEQSRNTPTFIVERGGKLFGPLTRHFDRIWEGFSREPDPE